MGRKPTHLSPKIIILATLALVIAFLALMFTVPSAHNFSVNREGLVTFLGLSGPAVLHVELADSPQEHSQGLMYREQLSPGEGMLFIFEGDSLRSFWMKNTLIPLDMIFINSSLGIVSVHKDVPPCATPSCPTYGSGSPAMYVVEANAGFSSAFGIKPGQSVSISLF